MISQVHGKGVTKTDEFGGSGNGSGNIQTKQLKKQLETAQDDLYKMEKVSCCSKYMLFYTPENNVHKYPSDNYEITRTRFDRSEMSLLLRLRILKKPSKRQTLGKRIYKKLPTRQDH